MKMKKMKKTIFIATMGCLLLTQPSISAYANSKDETRVVKKSLANEIHKTRKAILQLDKEIVELEEEIKGLNVALKIEKDLEVKKREIEAKEAELNERWESMTEKMLYWQVKGKPDDQWMEAIFSSTSIGDAVNRAFTFRTLMDAEREQMEELENETRANKAEKKKLENKILTLKKQKIKLKANQKNVNQKRKTLETKLKTLEEDELKRIQKELKAQEERKRLLMEKQVSSEQFEQYRSLMSDNANYESYFIRPASGTLTSPYGIRPNPFGGSGTEFHTGIDIANPQGTPIVSTADGVVIKVVHSNQGYGNYILLKHEVNGEVFHSLYAHLSMIGVQVGEEIKQGEVIGLMGTTGRSTGSHLHFEIQDENRNHLNPQLFLEKGENKKAKV